MGRFLHSSICWLLSAVLLLTNGWPVAIQHAHDVGDNPYHHSHGALDRQVDVHHFASIGETGDAMSGVTEHIHMLWLGWELTIVPPKGYRPGPCPSAAAVGMLLQLVDEGDSSAVPAAPPATSPAMAVVDAPRLFTQRQRFVSSHSRVSALPLCDTARHLRSGVQLT